MTKTSELLTPDNALDAFTINSNPSSTILDDLLTEHETQVVSIEPSRRTAQDPLIVDSVLDTLTAHSEPVVVALDWERDGWRVSKNGMPAKRVSRADLLKMPFAEADVVVVEQAHLRERNAYSVAQVYDLDQLRKLACAEKIRLFPGKTVHKASLFAGNVTGKLDAFDRPTPDKNKDAESIASFASAHPEKLYSWKRFVLPENDPSRRLWAARDALRADLQEALNPLRVAWNNKPTAEKYQLPEVVDFCALLDRVYDDLTDGIKEQYGIKRGRNGIRVDKMASAITLYLCVFHRDGRLRLNPSGKFIGIRFILDSVGMSHSHKPNMARSQLTWHGLRHYKGTRREYMKNMRNFLALMRDSASV